LLQAINAIHFEENGNPLEVFLIHDANCENNCMLDLKAKPFRGRPYLFIVHFFLNLTLIYPTLNLDLCLNYLFINKQ